MKNTIVKYINRFDKNLHININDVSYTEYENKAQIYIDFKNQDITNLIESLRFYYDVNNEIVNITDRFSVFTFYITCDIPLDYIEIQGEFNEVYNVETQVFLTSRNYKMVYNNYLKSQEWYILKNLALKYSNYKCSKCGETENLNIHHLNYNNIGNEEISDLITVCNSCHKEFHKI